MENLYTYFNRDISWLSFNYRVLLEAEDSNLPIYERIKFLSIHASNLEEFYKIRVSEHRSVILKKIHSEENPDEAKQTLDKIKSEVTRQQGEFFRILSNEIIPELERNHIILHMDNKPEPEHELFISNYFNEEIFPFLLPVMLMKEDIRIFIRDNRLYQVVELRKKDTGKEAYAILKIPHAKVPRLVELPKIGDNYYYMFVEDIISFNLHSIFIGYDIEGSYNMKISRDADIYVDEEDVSDIVETIKKKVKKRKIGDISRFVYDRRMPEKCLKYISETFHIQPEDMIPDNIHLNMEDIIKLPNPVGNQLKIIPSLPLKIKDLEKTSSVFSVLDKKDVFLHYPYHRFDYFLRFLKEAAISPEIEEIKLTQYRVAPESEVINTLIDAARNGKKVTVFVELKARFDEENNLQTARKMEGAGISIIYSIPKLKVHAKVALVTGKKSHQIGKSYAFLSTGNFNENTARLYSDMSVMTSNPNLTNELKQLFSVFDTKNREVTFNHLLVTQFNMNSSLITMIQREMDWVRQGKKAYIILKMNGMQDSSMIDELYRASEAGVKIDLIIRGICCIVPGQSYSKNIRITRIVDQWLEHSRVWYFYNGGEEDLYLTSADWMRRNLYRRIETAFPVYDRKVKRTIIQILNLQLKDNVKACFIDENLNNISKCDDNPVKIRSQVETYNLLAKK